MSLQLYSLFHSELVTLEPDFSLVPSNILKPVYAIGKAEQIPYQPVIWTLEEIEKVNLKLITQKH